MPKLDLAGLTEQVDVYDNASVMPEVLADIDLEQYLPQKALKILHHGTDAKPTKTARLQLLEFLDQRLANLTENDKMPRPGISMKELLTPNGIKLFEAAIKEEAKSKAYREAVFLQSMNSVEGPEWKKKLVLWVGGPSASGKTYGSENAIKAIADQVPSKSNMQHRNDYINIDGAIEREVSQMRKLVLQLALAHNYKGITDLNSYCSFKIDGKRVKEYVQGAATKHDSLSLVIPETFAESMFSWSNRYKSDDMNAYHNDPRVFQAFSEVTGMPNAEDKFQDVVKYMGSTRAWLEDDQAFDPKELSLNNMKIPCESKAYDSMGFYFGKTASKEAATRLAKLDPTSIYIQITNDLIPVKQQSNGSWVECTSQDGPDFKISQRDFGVWKNEVENNEVNDLKAWWNKRRKEGQLAPPLIDARPNDLVEIPLGKAIASPDLKSLCITRRDADRYHEELGEKSSQLKHVRAWLINELEQDRLTTPTPMIEIFLMKSSKEYQSKSVIKDEPEQKNSSIEMVSLPSHAPQSSQSQLRKPPLLNQFSYSDKAKDEVEEVDELDHQHQNAVENRDKEKPNKGQSKNRF